MVAKGRALGLALEVVEQLKGREYPAGVQFILSSLRTALGLPR